jgi:nucleotide-binding universal stress UspA family protein
MVKLLVPLDGATLAEAALPVAEQLARRLGATIVLIGVMAPRESAVQAAEARKQVRRWLDPAAERLRDLPATERIELRGDPAAGIMQVARDEAAGLIVMATHGHSGLSQLARGSTAEAVLRASPVPVALVRPRDAA